jgi:hypothetical protein
MSNNDSATEIHDVEEALYSLVEQEFAANAKELRDAGLRLELDSVH